MIKGAEGSSTIFLKQTRYLIWSLVEVIYIFRMLLPTTIAELALIIQIELTDFRLEYFFFSFLSVTLCNFHMFFILSLGVRFEVTKFAVNYICSSMCFHVFFMLSLGF